MMTKNNMGVVLNVPKHLMWPFGLGNNANLMRRCMGLKYLVCLVILMIF